MCNRRSITAAHLLLVALPAICAVSRGQSPDPGERILAPDQTRRELLACLEPHGARLTIPPNAAAWDAAAPLLRKRFREEVFVRGVPPAWASRDLETIWTGERLAGNGYVIRKLRYEVVPGMWAGGLLYEPTDVQGRVPAVLNLSGHETQGAAIAFKQTICANLAKRGMLALNLEWFGTGQLLEPRYRHWNLGSLDLCGCSGAGVFYLGIQRGLDILLSHPAADPDRVAATGLSGGGWQTLLIGALDPRVKVAVPNAGYVGFAERRTHAEDVGDLEQNPVDLLAVGDYVHLTALLAPRPALLIYNAKDDCCYQAGRARTAVFEPVVPLYQLYGRPDRFAFHVNHDPGTHNYERENREALYRFLNRQFLAESQWQDSEIPMDREIRSSQELAIAYPTDNRDYQSLALELLQSLPRYSCPTGDPSAIEAWRQRVRPLLRDCVRPDRDVAVKAEPAKDVKTAPIEGATARAWRLHIGERWTLPLVEYQFDPHKRTTAPSSTQGAGTTIVLCDNMLAEGASIARTLSAPGGRVLVANILFTGECEADVELPGGQIVPRARWVYSQLLNAAGVRPLGIQAGQLRALVNWAAESGPTGPMRVVADGRVSSLAALIVAALQPGKLDGVSLRGMPRTWKELLTSGVSYPDAPSLFCFGLAELLGVDDLIRLAAPTVVDQPDPPASLRLLRQVPPVMAVWGWREATFEPEGFRPHIDLMARHSGVNLLATTIRAPGKRVTDPAVREQIRRAAEYAARFGIGIAMDLDVRLAREPFRDRHPDELQEMLRLREIPLKDAGEVTLSVASDDLSDHYTFNATHYIPLSGRLLRAYVYERAGSAIRPETVQDITSSCRITEASEKAVSVSIPCGPPLAGKTACVMVAFTHLTPDAFAPHLLPFQRQILESYKEVKLAGACKDEWGFPPCYDGNPAHNDYWYSRYLAEAYAQESGGRELLRDCLLMTHGETGREAERVAAINHFNELVRLRHGQIEQDFYDAVKAIWGKDAVVATHPTWWPYPDRREFKKNGLDWWIVRRDWAQTDEITPYCVRTALAKKWDSPVWYNMYYSANLPDYPAEMWAGALTGGRIDYHPVWPSPVGRELIDERYAALLRGGLMRGDCRIRLLNFITRSPLDCPVAVVFGQPGAMNWAGDAWDDVGLTLSDALWRAGYPADLIPTTEIWNGSLALDPDGRIRYGAQRYHSAVLYHPQFDRPLTADFFRKAAQGRTALYRVGDWTRSFNGQPLDGASELPATMTVLPDAETAAAAITQQLAGAHIVPQPKADRILGFGDCRSFAPPATGESRLLDGTHLVVAGARSAAGDPIQRTLQVDGQSVSVDAVGVVAVRLDRQGRLDALAAGGLRSFQMRALALHLDSRVDLALWRDERGGFRGVIQDFPGEVPEPLTRLTREWIRLEVPPALD